MRKGFLKNYMIYILLLALLGSATLVMGKNYLDRYEKEQEALDDPVTPTAAVMQEIVEKFRYKYELPLSFSFETGPNDIVISEIENDNTKQVVIESKDKELVLVVADEYGNRTFWKQGGELKTNTFCLWAPDNYTVSFYDGRDIEKYCTDVKTLPELERYSRYVSIPKVRCYSFKDALCAPDITITDNMGRDVKADWDKMTVDLSVPGTSDEPPAGITNDEILEAVRMYSRFVTNDLGVTYYFTDPDGNKIPYTEGMSTKGLTFHDDHKKDHGFSVLEGYILPGTSFYDYLKAYSTGPDIGLFSRHKPDPVFRDESVSDIVIYSEDIFSARVSFEKDIELWSASSSKWYMTQTDETTGTVFFIRTTDEKGIRWRISSIEG